MKHPDFLDNRDFTGEDKKRPSTLHMDTSYKALEGDVKRLSETASTRHDPRYLQEYIKTGINMAQSDASDHDFTVLIRAGREMYRANCVFAPYRHIRKVSIFGSGIMQAAHEGAGEERSFGLNITLPYEQTSNHVVANSNKLINFYYFFVRKLNFVAESDAMVAFPGGFGTMDEVFETLTLIQTGKATIYPIVLLDSPGKPFWLHWLAYIRVELVDSGLISEDDLHLIHVTKNPAEAIDHIDRFYRIFHSYRFIGDTIAIRLNTLIPAQWVEHLERDFADLILPGGRMVQTGPLPDEADEPHLDKLPRIAFPIRRGNYGRLRLLIDRINEAPSRTYTPAPHA